MKIVTFNVNGIRARQPRLVEYLRDEKPEAVCRQELTCANENLSYRGTPSGGYEGVWHGQKAFNGVAIPSRGGTAPALRRRGLSEDPDDSHSRYIEAEVGDVVIASKTARD